MSSLLTRRDVIVVASVSCIYGIGSKENYEALVQQVFTGQSISRDQLLARLVDLQYSRNDVAFERGQFRVRGDVVELRPSWSEDGLRIEFFGDAIERLSRFEPLTGKKTESPASIVIFPAKQFVTPEPMIKQAILSIREELGDRIAWFEARGKLIEAQRIKMRTEYDLEMMEEMGFCSGIENYSRLLAGRPPGSRPCTLMDFFPKDYLLVMDESHATVPQIGGMHAGDRSRKTVLVEHGFRLPSALDNRPLDFQEFQSMQGQTIYLSATPQEQELNWSRGRVVEQIVRPTGLVDPKITLKPLAGQIDDLLEEIRRRSASKERTLVTALTKKSSEELTDYLRDLGVNVRYLHSEIDAIERVEVLRALRKGEFDVLIGINLLREGLDLPVSEYRRQRQLAWNKEHNITPRSVVRAVEESLAVYQNTRARAESVLRETGGNFDLTETLRGLQEEMLEASNNLEFEKAALLRDQIRELKTSFGEGAEKPGVTPREIRYKKSPRAKNQRARAG